MPLQLPRVSESGRDVRYKTHSMRIEEAVKSTLIGAAVSMHLTPGKKKGAGFGQAKDVPGKEHPTADPSLMVRGLA